MLECGRNRPGDLRLQDGLAAAVAGLSVQEFLDLPEDTKESHRERFVRLPIHRQLAPNLIVYIGAPAPNQQKPATSGQIHFREELVPVSDFFSWHQTWDLQDVSPTALGWMTRSLDPQAHFIFLSGIFAAWPSRWRKEPLSDQGYYESILILHLKITLYHELAHYLRNLVRQLHNQPTMTHCSAIKAHGVLNNNTPEKCIDHPSKIRSHPRDHSATVGEAGRQAESIAFGAIIDIALSMSYLSPFSFITNFYRFKRNS